MKKFQYDYRKVNSDCLFNINQMMEMGKDGWELTSILALPQANIYYFKKELVEKVEPVEGD